MRAPHVDGRGKIGSPDIRCPDTSVNREKYSQPVHVLYCQLPKFLDWRVLKIRVDQVPSELENPNDGSRFSFQIVHDPLSSPEENYAHSEIRAFVGTERRKRLPPVIDKLFRQILADRLQLVPLEELKR
jgi:hypothetical protein